MTAIGYVVTRQFTDIGTQYLRVLDATRGEWHFDSRRATLFASEYEANKATDRVGIKTQEIQVVAEYA